MKRIEKRIFKIKFTTGLLAVFVLLGAFYFAQIVFAQLPPPPPPPPPPGCSSTNCGVCVDQVSCQAQGCSWSGTACSSPAGGPPPPAGSAGYKCSTLSGCFAGPDPSVCVSACVGTSPAGTCVGCTDAQCTSCGGIGGSCGQPGACTPGTACPNTQGCVCSASCTCSLAGTICTNPVFGAVQCQIPSGTTTVFQCFSAQTGETSLAPATSRCQASCLVSSGGQCVTCPQGSVCTNSADCLGGGGTTGTKPGFQLPTKPGTKYPTGDCPPSQCPPPPNPGSSGINLTSLKPGNFSDFLSLLSCVFSFLLYFAIPIAVLVFVLAGVMFLTSRGEPDKVTTAKKIVLWGTVGFSVVLLAKGILSTILLFFGSSALQISCKFFS